MNLVKRFGLDNTAHARTPMAANAELTYDPSGESVDVTLYRSMIVFGDVVFGATNDSLAHSFADEMKAMFEMSIVGELTYFLGLQVK